MAFNAKLPIAVFCLLAFFLGTALTKTPKAPDSIDGPYGDSGAKKVKKVNGKDKKATKETQEDKLTSPRAELSERAIRSFTTRIDTGADGPYSDSGAKKQVPWESKETEKPYKQKDGGASQLSEAQERENAIKEVMATDVPKVKAAIEPNRNAQYFAIWLHIDEYIRTPFKYIPYDTDDDTQLTPRPNTGYLVAPPIVDENENFEVTLIDKSEELWIHSEKVLLNQMNGFRDLIRYTDGHNDGLTGILMYSQRHPCKYCAGHLVDICNKIKTADNSRHATRKVVCYLIYSNDYCTNHEICKRLRKPQDEVDAEVRAQILEPNGIIVFQMDEP